MQPLSHILCIDDEPDILEIVRFALEDVGGYQVSTCEGGKRFFECQEGQGRPDLILLDVMMPEIDGPETLKRLRADPKFEGVPVIFMTAKAQPAEIDHFLSLGAESVIAKPFDPVTLPSQLEKIWRRTSAE